MSLFLEDKQLTNNNKEVLTHRCQQNSSKTKSFLGRKNLDLASRQCSCPHSSQRKTVLGLERNHHVASSTLFAGLGPLQFLSFSKAERDSQGDTLLRSRGYQDQRDETPQNHHKRRIFTMLQSMVKKNGKVHQNQWGIFRRGQVEMT